MRRRVSRETIFLIWKGPWFLWSNFLDRVCVLMVCLQRITKSPIWYTRGSFLAGLIY